ncbi:hypothetical protein MBLNU457_6538t1 [Dothideomycetes sp. NU457]
MTDQVDGRAPHSVPLWEHENIAKGASTGNPIVTPVPKSGWKTRLDGVLSPYKTYLGMRRRWFLIASAATIAALLALIIGLSVGLSRNKSSTKDLPLPSNSQTFTGDLTYYGTGLGACGITSGDSDYIVSVSHIIFDAASTGPNPNTNPLCGRKIRATRFDEQVNAQRSMDLTVVDRCTGCQATDLDTSLGAFEHVAAQASGRVDVTWAWLPAASTGS